MLAVMVEGLTKRYAGALTPALAGIDLKIEPGQFFGVLGPNGAGKTTLISILSGIATADTGSIAMRAADGQTLSPRAAKAIIGLVPQELAFYPSLSVIENIQFFSELYGLSGRALSAATERALELGQLSAYRAQRADTLSGGLKRRLNLAIGIVHSPQLLILDEPTVGIDVQSRRFLLDALATLNRGGTTIIYTSHYLDEVESVCDSLAVIDHGRVIAAGPLRELLAANVIVMRTRTAPSAAFISALHHVSSVVKVDIDCERITLLASTPAIALAEILHTAARLHVPIAEARMGSDDLESVFFRLTGTRLRDATDHKSPTQTTDDAR